jgi:hypothetical protein
MRFLLLLLSLLHTSGLAAAIPQTHGVHPFLLSKYRPTGTIWTCLDGTKTISWSAVNDDYCDCPDGSDEPGASFHAVNLQKPYMPNQERARVPTTPSTARMWVTLAQISRAHVLTTDCAVGASPRGILRPLTGL